MLEPSVRRPWVDEVGKRELVYLSEALKWARVDDPSLVRPHRNEGVDGITEFVRVFHESDAYGSS